MACTASAPSQTVSISSPSPRRMALTSSRFPGASSAIRIRPPTIPPGAGMSSSPLASLPTVPPWARGVSNQKVAPSPGWLSTPISPPMISIRRREIASPNPVPP
ncbi:hypothetical protein D3C80_1230010 [compost metagenome]